MWRKANHVCCVDATRSHAGKVQLASEQVLMGQDCVDGGCGRLSCGTCARQCSAGLYKKCLRYGHWSS